MDIQLNWTTCIAAAGYVAANPAVLQALRWVSGVARRVNWKQGAPISAPVVMLILLALLTQVPADAQYRRMGGVPSAGIPDSGLKGAVASFDGTLRSITKKDFTVDLDNGNTVVFKIGKKTEFFVGEKAVKPKDVAAETVVKVEGTKDGFGVLTATKLTVKPDAPQPQ